jgi:hypothetical protein
MSDGYPKLWCGWWKPGKKYPRWQRICEGETFGETWSLLRAEKGVAGQSVVLPDGVDPNDGENHLWEKITQPSW